MSFITPKTRGIESLYPVKGFGRLDSTITAAGTKVVTWANMGVTAGAIGTPSKYKVWLLNKGTDPMFIKQSGQTILVAIGGSFMFEFLDAYSGDLTIEGTNAETFTIFATGQFKNVSP